MPKTNIIVASSFAQEYRRLRKRYPSLKSDLAKLMPILDENPETGRSLGGGIYKIRLAIKSKNKGKRSGGRIITSYLTKERVLYLLTIYDKSEQESISDQEIDALLHRAIEEHPPGGG